MCVLRILDKFHVQINGKDNLLNDRGENRLLFPLEPEDENSQQLDRAERWSTILIAYDDNDGCFPHECESVATSSKDREHLVTR